MPEVLEITDRIVGMRDGKISAALPTKEASLDQLFEFLSGATEVDVPDPPPPASEVLLSVRGRVEFDLHAGSIVARRWAKHPLCSCGRAVVSTSTTQDVNGHG